MTAIVLKPCPFCGSEDFLISERKDFVSVKCGQCETKVGARDVKTAIEYWNYRPIEDAKDEEITELKIDNACLTELLNNSDVGFYRKIVKHLKKENARLCEALEKVQK